MYVLTCNGRVAGRFETKASAHAEEERLGRLALKRGDSIVTRVLWEPPMAESEQEAAEMAFHQRLP